MLPNQFNPNPMSETKKAIAKPTRLEPQAQEKVEPTVKPDKVTPSKLGAQPKVHGPTFGKVTAIYH